MWTFILILLFLWFLAIIFNFFSSLGDGGTIAGMVVCLFIIVMAIHAWLCTNVSWYGTAVVAPEIDLELVADSWRNNSELEPLLGETITQGEDGNYYVTITDHVTNPELLENTPDIKISVTPENATLDKADTTLTITQVKVSGDAPIWLSGDNFRDQVTTLDKNFTYTIDGSKIRMNESSSVEPTKFVIKAKNKRGETQKTLIITRLPVYHACALYSKNHPGHIARDDITLCRKRAEYDEQKDRETQNKPQENHNSSTNNSSSSSSSKPSSGSSSTCYHYEAGRCWDDLELEAYDKGRYDKQFGYYGDSYYEGSNCDSVCQSILEEAYDEGYYDY